jgi:hypothetical protein
MDTTCSTAIKTYLTASAKSGALLRRLVALAFRGPVPVGVVDALVLVSLASDFRLVLSPASEPGPNEPTEPGPAEPVPSADLRKNHVRGGQRAASKTDARKTKNSPTELLYSHYRAGPLCNLRFELHIPVHHRRMRIWHDRRAEETTTATTEDR